MAKALSAEQLHVFAAHGARARLAELRAEIVAIRRAFPDIEDSRPVPLVRRRRRRRGRPAGAARIVPTIARRRRRRRGKLSAAGRAAISAAQKKRWAAIKRKKAASK